MEPTARTESLRLYTFDGKYTEYKTPLINFYFFHRFNETHLMHTKRRHAETKNIAMKIVEASWEEEDCQKDGDEFRVD